MMKRKQEMLRLAAYKWAWTEAKDALSKYDPPPTFDQIMKAVNQLVDSVFERSAYKK